MNTLTSPGMVKGDTGTVEELIARVLGRAHHMADALGAPSDARAILHVAQAFADELATLDSRFDRVQFIKDVTEDPS